MIELGIEKLAAEDERRKHGAKVRLGYDVQKGCVGPAEASKVW